jgi:hypothetical protein
MSLPRLPSLRALRSAIAPQFAGSVSPSALRATPDGPDDYVLKSRGEGLRLWEVPGGVKVRFPEGLYGRIGPRDARAEILRVLLGKGRRVVLQERIESGPPHLGRVVIDGPRSLTQKVTRLRLVPDPGARVVPAEEGLVFRQLFFSAADFYEDLAMASAIVLGTNGTTIDLCTGVLQRPRYGVAREVSRALRRAPAIESLFRMPSTKFAVEAARKLGAHTPERSEWERARLSDAIALVDSGRPAGRSCLWRVLAELSLDAGAALETVVFGLDPEGPARGDPEPGHVWLLPRPGCPRVGPVPPSFPTEFALKPFAP